MKTGKFKAPVTHPIKEQAEHIIAGTKDIFNMVLVWCFWAAIARGVVFFLWK